MVSSNSTTVKDARIRFPLRGYERMFTMADDGSMKIVHIMVLQGNSAAGIAALLAHLPQAVVSTFNRHPRMRAMQVRDAFATAEVQPKVTLETLSTMKLLEIRHLAHENESEDDGGESWEKFAETQSNVPFDRYAELPVSVRAWHYMTQHRVRLMVLSDHFMSDGISGLVVLNDIVSFAARLTSQQQEQEQDDVSYTQELPLRPSLYEMWLAPHKWTLRLRRWAVQLFGKAIFKSELRSFTPLVKPRSDQADFAFPVKINSSSALFALGTPENMQKTLRRCREEGVTFFGALAASVVLAYYLGSEQGDKKETTRNKTMKPFTLVVDVDFNMRKRVPCPAEEDHVGAYLATSALESLSKQGVDFATTGFWDLARRCKTELDDTLASFFMPLVMLFLDENVHSKLQPEFPQDLAMPHSISSDVNISNVGKYPYTTTHLFSNNDEELRIESVHVYNSSPHLGSAAILYVTSTDKFAFSMMHKYETKDAQRVFAAYTACVEHIGEIASGETLAQVASMVAHAVKSEGDSETGGTA